MRIGGGTRLVGALAALLAVGAMFIWACGGGGSSGDAKTADDYASKFCGALSQYADHLQDLSNTQADMEDPAAMKDFIDQMVPIFTGISQDLDKIDPPPEVADWHNGMVSGMSAAADIFSQMSAALDKPLDEAMAEITDLSSKMAGAEDPFSAVGDLPEEYQTAFDNNAKCQDLQKLNIFQ